MTTLKFTTANGTRYATACSDLHDPLEAISRFHKSVPDSNCLMYVNGSTTVHTVKIRTFNVNNTANGVRTSIAETRILPNDAVINWIGYIEEKLQ